MHSFSAILPGFPALLCAFVFSPFLLSLLAFRIPRFTAVAAGAGVAGFALNTLVPILLHVSGVPVTRINLSAVHLAIALALVLAARARRIPVTTLAGPNLCLAASVIALLPLLFPWTYLAGIDTYKWQDLAANVRLSENVPWLIHPLSLLGFTPRAYPPVQPLMLATAQILVPCGVDFGFYLVSVFTALTALFGAFELGRLCFGDERRSSWLAIFYVFSPVLMRYTHWATGRGIFMALMPFVLLGAAGLPRLPAAGTLFVSSILLALSHKTGVVTLAVLVAGAATAPLFAGLVARPATAILAIAVILLSPVLSLPAVLPGPAGHVAGALRSAVTRFGVLAPFVAATAVFPPRSPGFFARALILPSFAFFLLSFDSDIYAAMPATILAALAAARLMPAVERARFRAAATAVVLVLLATGALAVVGKRNINATPAAVRRAAAVIETVDPTGPITVEAPGMARRQVHGYVSGCPRFDVRAMSGSVTFIRPPPFSGPPGQVIRTWIAWARGAFCLDDSVIAWYGSPHAEYHVKIGSSGAIPADAEIIYSDNEVTIGVRRHDRAAR
jgi:hypothetical protein